MIFLALRHLAVCTKQKYFFLMFWWKPGILIPDLYFYSIKIQINIRAGHNYSGWANLAQPWTVALKFSHATWIVEAGNEGEEGRRESRGNWPVVATMEAHSGASWWRWYWRWNGGGSRRRSFSLLSYFFLLFFTVFFTALSPFFFLLVLSSFFFLRSLEPPLLSLFSFFFSPCLPCIYRQKTGGREAGTATVLPPLHHPRGTSPPFSSTRGKLRASGGPWSVSFWCF